PDTGQTLISGMGELHLEIIVDRMLREYNVQANVGRPQVAYRETIRKKALAEGRYIKQTGGKGQYGHCKIELHPLPSAGHENLKELSTDDIDELAKSVTGGTPGKWKFDKEHRFLFIDKIIGGSIPREFIPPIEAGIREALDNGILAGFCDSGDGKPRRQQRDPRRSASRADVRLRHGFAQPHAGSRHVHHAFLALRGIARGSRRRSRQEVSRREVTKQV